MPVTDDVRRTVEGDVRAVFQQPIDRDRAESAPL